MRSEPGDTATAVRLSPRLRSTARRDGSGQNRPPFARLRASRTLPLPPSSAALGQRNPMPRRHPAKSRSQAHQNSRNGVRPRVRCYRHLRNGIRAARQPAVLREVLEPSQIHSMARSLAAPVVPSQIAGAIVSAALLKFKQSNVEHPFNGRDRGDRSRENPRDDQLRSSTLSCRLTLSTSPRQSHGAGQFAQRTIRS